jgi:uncharacterized protein
MPSAHTLGSVGPTERNRADEGRLADVDALRGFALFGILLVNITYFSSQFRGTGVDDPRFGSGVDVAIRFLTDVFIENKFYLMFSFLFGYSFTLQMASFARRGMGLVAPMLRRCLGLFVIGVLHATLLFHGDILTLYAVLCVLLLTVFWLPPRAAAFLGGGILVATATAYAFRALSAVWDTDGVRNRSVIRGVRHAEQAYRGSWGDVFAQRISDLKDMIGVLLEYQMFGAFAMFLFGLAAGKIGLFRDPTRYGRYAGRVLLAGLLIGVPGGLLYAVAMKSYVSTPVEYLAAAVEFISAPLLMAAYIVLAITVFHRIPVVSKSFAPAGRMALTNYLTQSLVQAFIFTGYGFAFTGQVSPLIALIIALGIYVFQLGASALWLRTHRYGPVEWALRTITYAKVPAWRK